MTARLQGTHRALTNARCPHGMLIGSVQCQVRGCVAAERPKPISRVAEGGKTHCSRCGWKDRSEFSSRPDGRATSLCRACDRVRAAESYRQRKERRR